MPGAEIVPGLGSTPAPFRAHDSAERQARLSRRLGPRLAEVTARCSLAPDPDLALAGVERYLDAAPLPAAGDLLDALALLTGSSRLAAQSLARDPGLLRRAARSRWVRRERPE
ncbi:MAG: bifunctional [glutamate--ammonia ligase]-adenylyl-L-tyrosine phosphorylase/[glutamate--ammonia-ligase] adenylyltransferase, partial [Anaeromyxobacteraceae bacterium]